MQQLVKDILHAVDVIHKINVKNNVKMHCFLHYGAGTKHVCEKNARTCFIFFADLLHTDYLKKSIYF